MQAHQLYWYVIRSYTPIQQSWKFCPSHSVSPSIVNYNCILPQKYYYLCIAATASTVCWIVLAQPCHMWQQPGHSCLHAATTDGPRQLNCIPYQANCSKHAVCITVQQCGLLPVFWVLSQYYLNRWATNLWGSHRPSKLCVYALYAARTPNSCFQLTLASVGFQHYSLPTSTYWAFKTNDIVL